MTPETCEVPPASAIGREAVAAAFFRDACKAPLSHAGAGVVDVFFAVFGHHPRWMKRLLILRNRAAAACGLATAADDEILSPRRKQHYAAGDTIGPWPLFMISPTELVAGRDNPHLDFRVSVLLEQAPGASSAVISTVCTTHNAFGKLYLLCIIPFHKWGMRLLIRRARSQGRL